MSDPLIVTITFTQGDVKMLQLMHLASENSGYDLPIGIDLGDGRIFNGYEFKPFISNPRMDKWMDERT